MNYRKVYMAIIAKAIKENRKKLSKDAENYVYYEEHHILPKNFFQHGQKENRIWYCLLPENISFVINF